jgi:acetyltransferase-like isoleucine patch superfamily enzyme
VRVRFRAVILLGVEIGERAVVVAGAVVSSNVPLFAIVAGSLARAVGERSPVAIIASRRDDCSDSRVARGGNGCS